MTEYFLDVAAGNAASNAQSIRVHGRNPAVGTTFAPVNYLGVYRTPQVSGATTLRVKAGNANDTSNGSGARQVSVTGVNSSGEFVTEYLTTNGASAGTAGSISFLRLWKTEVTQSGTYATQSTGSHAANIVIENSAGTENWDAIDSTGFPMGVSESGVFTVPKGKMAYVTSVHYVVDTTKTTRIALFNRDNILQTAAPYSPLKVVWGVTGAATSGVHDFEIPLGPFGPLTDLGLMAAVSSATSSVEAYFEILLRDQE